MEYLVRFSQSHESFRLAELEALATLEDVALEVLSYRDEVRVLSGRCAAPVRRFVRPC